MKGRSDEISANERNVPVLNILFHRQQIQKPYLLKCTIAIHCALLFARTNRWCFVLSDLSLVRFFLQVEPLASLERLGIKPTTVAGSKWPTCVGNIWQLSMFRNVQKRRALTILEASTWSTTFYKHEQTTIPISDLWQDRGTCGRLCWGRGWLRMHLLAKDFVK